MNQNNVSGYNESICIICEGQGYVQTYKQSFNQSSRPNITTKIDYGEILMRKKKKTEPEKKKFEGVKTKTLKTKEI